MGSNEDYVGQAMTVLFVQTPVTSAPVCVSMVSPWTLGATVSYTTLIEKSRQETFKEENNLKYMFLRLALELAWRELMGSSNLFEVRILELSMKQTENTLSQTRRETASCKGLVAGHIRKVGVVPA